MEQDESKTSNYDLYECGFCRRNFLTLWCLQLHEKTHNKTVQWCEECGTRFTCFSHLYQHLPVHISGENVPRLDGKSGVDDETRNSDLGGLGVTTDQFRTERDHENERGETDQFRTECIHETESGEIDQIQTERVHESEREQTDQFRTDCDHETEREQNDQIQTEHDHETEREQTDQFRTDRDHETEREQTDQFRTDRDHDTEREQTDQFRTDRDHETEREQTDQFRTDRDHETEREQTDQFRIDRDHETEREQTDQFRTDRDHDTEREQTDQFRTDRDHETEREQTDQFRTDHEPVREKSSSDDLPEVTDGSGKYDGHPSELYKPEIDGSDHQIDANVANNDCNNHEEIGRLNSSNNEMRTMSCHKCNKSFSYKTILMLHLRKHQKKTPYKCQICGLGFISWNAYKLHRKSYGNMPHKKRDPCKPVEKASALPVGYCSKMFPPSRRFQKANSGLRSSLVTGTTIEDKDGGDSSPASKYSGWFLCLICGAKVRGRRGSLAHHKLFHLGHELRNVKTSRVPGLQRPWLKCSMCNKKMRSRTNLDIHEAWCDKGRKFTEESSEKVRLAGGASSGFSSRGSSRFPEFDSELRRLSNKHGLTGPWRQCVLCSMRCRGWHQFNRHLEMMHTETYRSITTERTSSMISDSFKGMSRAGSRNINYALSFTKCTDNMQCSWYSCSNCKRKFQGRESMKRHYATCSRIADICGTRNTVLNGTVTWKRKTVNWCKTSQKKNCSMYRCRFCGEEFKGRRRVVEHVRHCSKKQQHSGPFPAAIGDVKSQDWLSSQSESQPQSESQQQGHASDNPSHLFGETLTICSKCGKPCKDSIDLCAHRKTCGESETSNDLIAPDSETNDAFDSSPFWRYGCWYCCRSCKEKCRGYQRMLDHVCPPTSNFERFQTNWYRCRSCGQSCRNHHGMRDHVCPPPVESSGEVGSQPAAGPKPDAARHSSQYCAALYGFAQNGSWYKCNVCGQNCMGKWSLEKHTHDEASSSQVTSDFCKNGTWYWCKVCKMRLRGEKGLKSHVHAGSKCSTDEEEPWVAVGSRGPDEDETVQGTPETSNECKEVVMESPVLVNGDNPDDGHDAKPQSDGEQGEYFGWTVITEFSDDIHL